MSQIKTRWELFVISLSQKLNALNNAISGKVSTQIFNNQTIKFTSDINILTSDLNDAISELEFFKGLHFDINQSAAIIYLKNSSNTVITEINVGFLNNEGTKFTYNDTNQNLELRNDANELLSSIPISSFISNIANKINFNSQTPYILELKNSNNTVASSVNIGIQNIQNLEQRLNSIKTIYSSDDIISGNRNIGLTDKYVRFTTNSDIVEIKDNKITIPSLFTNKFGSTQSGQVLYFSLNNNLPVIQFGNNDINMLEFNSKNYVIKNLKMGNGDYNKILAINTNGEIAYVNGGVGVYEAGEGISINGNIISLAPSDSVKLTFNW